MKVFILLASVLSLGYAQKKYADYTTPVPILKQIDKHNEDGSYSYGYEAADGTYKIETKYNTGEVYGKYGYIDDRGNLREVEYGASKRGFEPAGNEIQVPPPTLTSDADAVVRPLAPNEEDDGQYREDPAAYYKNDPNLPKYDRPSYPSYQHSFHGFNNNYAPSYQPYNPPQPAWNPPAYNYAPPTPHYNPAPRAPQYNPAPYYNPTGHPAYPGWNQFQGHPAQNVDIFTGSYTVQYR